MTHDLEDRLREAFAYRSERTEIGTDSSHPDVHDGTTRRRPPAMLALAAASVLVIAGLVAVNAIRSALSPDTAPLASLPEANLTPIDLAADDLSLDDWITTPTPDAPTPTWTVLDVTALPPGVVLVSQAGSVSLVPPIDPPSEASSDIPTSHQYRAQLRDDTTDIVFDVAVSSSQFVGPCHSLIDDMNAATDSPGAGDAGSDISRADVNGINAAVSGSLVCWMPAPGVIASVEAVGASSPDDLESSVVLARQLMFTDTEQLPQPVVPGEPGAAPDSAEFSGTLNGIPWSATVSASAVPSMNTYVDGRFIGAFSSDRLSQPTDTPGAEVGHLSLDAVPGKGAIAYGYTAPEVRTVRASNRTGNSVVLATFPRELETFFAVPIPDGVTIDTLDFLRSDGSIYATATIGPLPSGLEGGYGGLVPILRSPTPDD
jgi:hypothetical protein